MKYLVLAFLTLGFSFAQAQLCDDPIRQSEVCLKMQHMRSQVNALDAQRDLLQVNYSYLQILGNSLKETAKEIASLIKMDNPQHIEGIKNVAALAESMQKNALKNDPNTLVVANLVRSQCLNCHSNEAPASGIKWDKVFKNDWDSITKKCNAPGRNPYLCKNMNGMLSTYGYFLTANIAGIQNFEMAEQASAEIIRILGDLKKNNILHMAEEYRISAESLAREINTMAKNKNPDVFQRSMDLPQTCMKCHDSRGVNLDAKFSAKVSNVNWIKKAQFN